MPDFAGVTISNNTQRLPIGYFLIVGGRLPRRLTTVSYVYHSASLTLIRSLLSARDAEFQTARTHCAAWLIVNNGRIRREGGSARTLFCGNAPADHSKPTKTPPLANPARQIGSKTGLKNASRFRCANSRTVLRAFLRIASRRHLASLLPSFVRPKTRMRARQISPQKFVPKRRQRMHRATSVLSCCRTRFRARRGAVSMRARRHATTRCVTRFRIVSRTVSARISEPISARKTVPKTRTKSCQKMRVETHAKMSRFSRRFPGAFLRLFLTSKSAPGDAGFEPQIAVPRGKYGV